MIQIYQYDFPDTADFEGDILNKNIKTNAQMETYAQLVLLLFLPFRIKSDILVNESFRERLCLAISENEITSANIEFLQNIQDAKSNSFRSA